MLEDRDYMRQPDYYRPQLSFTVALLVVNAAIFLVECVLAFNPPRGSDFMDNYFALSLEGLQHGYVWQLLTYQFLHAGWLHLIFNMLAIYFFGRAGGNRSGPRPISDAVFVQRRHRRICQMAGRAGLAQSFSAARWSAPRRARYGLVAAFAVLNWWERFTLLMLFLFPSRCADETSAVVQHRAGCRAAFF